MGIMTRFARLFKADIHGVMDQIENKELMLKQCLREMETAICEKQAKLNSLISGKDHIESETRHLKKERDKIEQDLCIAMDKEKDDIARLLIKKRIKIDQQINACEEQAESADREIRLLTEKIEAQKNHYAEMQLRSDSWLKKSEYQKWNESTSWMPPHHFLDSVSDQEVELELIKQKERHRAGGASDEK